MKQSEQVLQAENQWDLMVEHGHGIQNGFHGLWAEGDDPEELSRLLRADPDSRLECDLETAVKVYGRMWERAAVWIGPHAPGWTHVLAFGLHPCHPAVRNLGRRLVLEMFCREELGVLEPLNVYYDGRKLGDVTPPYDEGGDMHLAEYLPYAPGPEFGATGSFTRDVHFVASMVGRITGRFIDRDWWTATRTLYRVPDGSWESR
ncbi:hypothetical protein F5972_20745 [Microbispora cellulosiformans]|uniref:Uncharacterized protein n=1 Tax=Microbispora cellulosiformans TaxID=2614688 RepID=A0A5J5JYJ7_9ACTN|nr:hypothetical protein [Microbispora cellulosiformans]KAA9376898.1 hypothetical protein F5972_20745 [Microbispora cellulosiformans]